MSVTPKLKVGPSVVAIQPTATELDRWPPLQTNGSWLSIENTDGSQSYSAWLEVRAVFGSGNFSRLSLADWLDIAAGEPRVRWAELAGLSEVRLMATATGAGGNCTYTRLEVAGP